MKQKLLHIMMGKNNPDLQKGLDSVFECVHFDWIDYIDDKNKLQSEVLSVFYSFNPNVVFMHIQSEAIYTNVAKEMSNSAIVVNWTGDVRFPIPSLYLDIGKNIDITLFTNMNDVVTCKSNGVKADFLQVGFDSTKFNPLGSVNSSYPEIIFMGTNYVNEFPLSDLRNEMVLRLKKEFGNRFGVYGGGWGGIEDGNITSYEEEGKAYRSCKIAINLSHFAYSRYSSDRMFRILGSGAFCLTHYFPELEKDFKVGKDLVVWNDVDDLVKKINKYLLADEERGLIALNGCYNARTNFTWNHFAENLKNITDKINK